MRISKPQAPLQRPQPSLVNQPQRPSRSPLPFIIVVILLAAGGFFGWKMYVKYKSQQGKPRPKIVQQPTKPTVKKPEPKPEVVEAPPEAPKPREKTPEEIRAEEEAARKAVLAEIAEARKDPNVKPLTRFGGVLFGEPIKGAPVRWGTVLDNDAGASLDTRGATFAIFGPELKKPILSYGRQPLVWVTPKTHKAYRVEFSRPLALKRGAKHDPEVTNTVAFLKQQPIFKDIKVFTPIPQRPDRTGCEYVMPIGNSTITIGEYGNDLLFSVEQGDVKAEAKAEADAVRQEKRADLDDGKALDSTRYPHGDFGKYPRMKFKESTPKSFCGVVFGRVAPASATPVNPKHGAKGFYLDYKRGKCPVFRGFDFGKADTDSLRGGVYALRLYSPGGAEGLDDADYFENVKKTLADHYKVTPTEKKIEGLAYPEMTYVVGDVTIAFGPEPNGGFYLTAEHKVLADLARQSAEAKPTTKKPAAKKTR